MAGSKEELLMIKDMIEVEGAEWFQDGESIVVVPVEWLQF